MGVHRGVLGEHGLHRSERGLVAGRCRQWRLNDLRGRHSVVVTGRVALQFFREICGAARSRSIAVVVHLLPANGHVVPRLFPPSGSRMQVHRCVRVVLLLVAFRHVRNLVSAWHGSRRIPFGRGRRPVKRPSAWGRRTDSLRKGSPRCRLHMHWLIVARCSAAVQRGAAPKQRREMLRKVARGGRHSALTNNQPHDFRGLVAADRALPRLLKRPPDRQHARKWGERRGLRWRRRRRRGYMPGSRVGGGAWHVRWGYLGCCRWEQRARVHPHNVGVFVRAHRHKSPSRHVRVDGSPALEGVEERDGVVGRRQRA
eukprot:Opistho-1_new@61899